MRPLSRGTRTVRALSAAVLATAVGAAVLAAPSAGAVAPASHRAAPKAAEPGDRFPLFDFSDSFYTRNGIDPAGLVGRRSGTDGLSVVDTSPDRNHRNVRVTFTLPGYDPSGNSLFFTVMSDLAPTAFTNNQAGRTAKALAEASPVYVFPTKDGDPLAVNHNRQADLVDTSHGYFSNNPLGLWVHIFVSYTDKAFNTPAGRQALADLQRKNGLALDGTPIIKSVSDLQNLTKQGFVLQQKRAVDATGRYFVCPVFKDPRDGAIAKDAFLATVRQQDGNALPAEQHFVDDFNSLQRTGDWR